MLLTLFFAWDVAQHVPRIRSKMKRGGPMIKQRTHFFKFINEACALMIEYSILSVKTGLIVEILFMLFSIYNAVKWAENE